MSPDTTSRMVVKFVAEHATDAAGLADRLAGELPGGRVVRVSGRGRAVLVVEGDVAAMARTVAERPEVDWAEPDTTDRAVAPDEDA